MADYEFVWRVPCALLVLLVVLVASYVPRWRRSFRYRNLPPGPHCFPLFGYLPLLNPTSSHSGLNRMTQLYGRIFGLYVGRTFGVVVEKFETAKEALHQKAFWARPDRAFRNAHGQHGLLNLSGDLWRKHRTFQEKVFQQLGVGRENNNRLIIEEVSLLIESLKGKEGRDIDLNAELDAPLNNLIVQLLYGRRFQADHPFLEHLPKHGPALAVNAKVRVLAGLFPWLSPFLFLLPAMRRARKHLIRMDEIMGREIDEHRRTMDPSEPPRDFIDYFLLQMATSDCHPSYTVPALLANLRGLFVASGDTTRKTLVWFLLLLAQHQDVQSRVLDEIDAVLGPDGEPTYQDGDRLPLTRATIMESMRWMNIIHFNVPRLAVEDTVLSGYDVPKGTVLLYNMTSHFRNPDLWERPDDFWPDRFLSPNGLEVITPEHFMPFSLGKRNCLGRQFAKTQLFFFAVCFLQKFRILPPEGGVVLDVKAIFSKEPAYPWARLLART